MNTPKKLSCKRCQTRKVKCNRLQPCSSCAQTGTPCEYRNVDARRRPVSQAYLAALESRLAWYESSIQKLKDSPSSDRDALLKAITSDINLDEHSGAPDVRRADLAADQQSYHGHTMALLPGPSGNLQFHGPTSLYLDDSCHQAPPPVQLSAQHLESWPSRRIASTLGIDDGLIHACLRLFFIHEYYRCMFIYREVFLEDYFNHNHGGKYWSYPLVYAVCALGAARSEDVNIRSKAHLLAKCAQEAIFTYGLSAPVITNVQALLCVAFHELGQGSSTLGWLFSGMAFRMGQEMGFHQDPQTWINSDKNLNTESDIEVRRRVYWGCYVADKHISLFLGRPVQLMDNDAAVIPSEQLPDYPDDHPWFGLGNIASADSPRSMGERPQLTLALKHTVPLGEILQDAMSTIFSPKSAHKSEAAISSTLGELNLRLNRWHSGLPEQLQWSQWLRNGTALKRHVLELHLFYHSTMLSLNRHFLSASHNSLIQKASREACVASCDQVVNLLRHFRNEYGSVSASLMMIYAVVLTVIILTASISTGPDTPSRRDSRVAFCLRTLHESSGVFKLANEAYLRLINQLKLNASYPENGVFNTSTAVLNEQGSSQQLSSSSPVLIALPKDELFDENLELDHSANLTMSGLSEDRQEAATPGATEVANFLFEPSSLSQHTVDMFTLHMHDDPVDSFHGGFRGWFSGAFD